MLRRLRTLLWRVGGLFRKAAREHDLTAEFDSHLQAHVEDNIRAGMVPEEARREAALAFGSVETAKEEYRNQRGLPFFETLVHDLRHAARALRKNPGLTAVAIVSLALGIGVNMTLFTAINAALFQRPTVADAAGVVAVERGNGGEFSYPNYRDLRDSGIFADVAGWHLAQLNYRSGDATEHIVGLIVTANFFDTLGIAAGRGRAFTAQEAAPERMARLAVLSHSYWLRRFQGEIGVLGRSLDLNGQAFLVLGILPEGYRPVTGVISPDVYVPASDALVTNLASRQGGFGVSVLARLRADGTTAQAQAAVTAFDRQLERTYPDQNNDLGRPATVIPLKRMSLRGAPPETVLLGTLLTGLSGLVLLIACGNIAGLLLSRAAVRQREIAVRIALGATRGRVMQLMLSESLLLAIAGAAVGLFMAFRLIPLLSLVTLPGQAPVQITLQPDFAFYAYACGLALVTGVICGIAPALRASRPDVVGRIQQGAQRGTTGRMRLQHAFVIGQVAASVILLAVSALFLRGLVQRTRLDPGFDIDHGVVAIFRLEPNRYSKDSTLLFAQRVQDRLSALPGVRSTAVASIVPLSGDTTVRRFQLEVEGRPLSQKVGIPLNFVGPRYFETMAIPLLAGREFQTSDRTGAPFVAIVNQTFARSYFPNGSALGKRVGNQGESPFEIVGIVKDSKYGVGREAAQPIMYYAWAQLSADATEPRPLVVHLRIEGAPASALQSVSRAIGELDPAAAVDVRTLQDATSFETSIRRVGSALLGTLGGLGLLLAMVGLYGVMAYAVASRTTEIGIRMALGASSRRVLRDVLLQGLRLVAMGLAIGTPVSLIASRPLATFLAGLSPSDPVAFGATAVVLLLVGTCACYVPARRATRVDPMAALRQE